MIVENIFRFCAKSHLELDAFHPGVLEIEPAKVLTTAERLAVAEATMLSHAIEQSLAGEGEARGLAILIVSLRADLRG